MEGRKDQHQYDLGIIGNCSFLALIDKEAKVNWLCWPRFDSSFVFGSLLDEEKGGNFYIEPEWENFETNQNYIHNTNVLETSFDCEDGKYKVIDFAPRFYHHERYYMPLMLVRKIVPLEGTPRIRVACNPVGQYGELIPSREIGSNHIQFNGLNSNIRLTTNVSLSFIENEQAFVLNETKYLVLTFGQPLEVPIKSGVENYLEQTIKYWQTWVKNTSISQYSQGAVIRSALALKLHQYQDTGAIISAATTSLPEYPGSTRNWDYRFCWLSATNYTMRAWNDLSHFGILEDYTHFIQNIVLNEDQRYHPLYPIAIDRNPTEQILPLQGYQGDRPVRVGNQTYEHVQNDIYGQVLVTLLPLFTDARLMKNKSSSTLLGIARHCLEMIEETMEEPDNGIWEFRGTIQLNCYTLLYHWAGSHAAKKLARAVKDEDMGIAANQMIKKASEKIEECFNEQKQCYTQSPETDRLDASLLQLINMGYLDPLGSRAQNHLKALEKELKDDSGLFFRYRHEDDFGLPQSAYLPAAFWYVEALTKMDKVEEASYIFENLLQYANHLNLMSETITPENGSQWGNFPMVQSHVGLVNAAFAIARKIDKPLFMS